MRYKTDRDSGKNAGRTVDGMRPPRGVNTIQLAFAIKKCHLVIGNEDTVLRIRNKGRRQDKARPGRGWHEANLISWLVGSILLRSWKTHAWVSQGGRRTLEWATWVHISTVIPVSLGEAESM